MTLILADMTNYQIRYASRKGILFPFLLAALIA
jgi:hypothetical protein